MEFQATFSPTPGYVPTYFLPWADDFAIRLTIPPMGQRTGKGRSDPGNFFTAAISGCSVIFQGTPDNPTIYHCGGNSGYAGDLDDGAAFWEAVVDELIADDAANVRRDRGQVQASVVGGICDADRSHVCLPHRRQGNNDVNYSPHEEIC